MKYLAYIHIIIIIGMMMACSEPHEYTEALSQAINIMKNNPDSAMRLLDSLGQHEQHFGRHFLMQYRLHRTNALNKLDMLFNSTNETHQFVNYFDTHGTPNEQMLAHYLLGRAYYDTGELPMALKCFQDATAKADTTAKDCDFVQLSRVYGQMGEILQDQRSPRKGMVMDMMAYNMANRGGDSINAVIYYWNIAEGYFMEGKYDSALYISIQASEMFISLGRPDMVAGNLPIEFDVNLRRKNYSAAKKAMDEYERHFGFFDNNGEITGGRESYYESKGRYYTGIGKLDSALFFYCKYLNVHPSIAEREEIYRGLIEIYHQKNEMDSIMKYTHLFAEANDSANILHSSVNLISDHDSTGKDVKRYVSIGIQDWYWGGLLLAALTCFIFIFYKKYIKHIKKEYDNRDTPNRLITENSLLTCDIVVKMHAYAKKDSHPKNEEWMQLSNEVIEKIPTFANKINSAEYQLTDQEQKVCMLTRTGITPSEIAIIMVLTKQRVSNIRNSINMKMFGQKGSKTLDANLKRL